MSTRFLILKLAAMLSLWLCGCNMPNVTPQPITPATTQHTLTIKVDDGRIKIDNAEVKLLTGSASAERCDCGCNHEGCRCSSRSLTRPTADTSRNGSGPQIVSGLKDSKPVVEMLTDFEPGQCGACDLAWSDWQTNGKDWPFVLVKRRGADGTSPAFRFADGRVWRPSSYSVGGLVNYWRSR